MKEEIAMFNLSRAVAVFLAIILVLNVVQVALLINVKNAVNELQNTYETIPETEAVETTECTSAPDNVDETIIPTTEETIPETTEAPTEPEIDERDLELLACVIYNEAGGDDNCDECRRRVADVVLNRVADERFPNTIEEVLLQPNQYGSFSTYGIFWPERAKDPYEANALARAWRIAEEVLRGQHSELYGNGYIWQAGFKQGTDNIYCCHHYYGR